MAIEYSGSDFLYVVEVPAAGGGAAVTHRAFNQTDGSDEVSSDDITLETKDKTGSDYGAVTHTISFGGVLTEGDPAVEYLRSAVRQKRFVRIYTVNVRTTEAEVGLYKINTFGRDFGNGDFATYSVDASLNGLLEEISLTTVPEGAPDSEVTA